MSKTKSAEPKTRKRGDAPTPGSVFDVKGINERVQLRRALAVAADEVRSFCVRVRECVELSLAELPEPETRKVVFHGHAGGSWEFVLWQKNNHKSLFSVVAGSSGCVRLVFGPNSREHTLTCTPVQLKRTVRFLCARDDVSKFIADGIA